MRVRTQDAIYRGYARGNYTSERVTVQRDGGPEEPLCHYVRHSPSGFAWGYNGSGPAELARCILLDHCGMYEGESARHDELIVKTGVSYQDFKVDVIAGFQWAGAAGRRDDPAWTLTSEEIDAWIAQQAGAPELPLGYG